MGEGEGGEGGGYYDIQIYKSCKKQQLPNTLHSIFSFTILFQF